MTADVCSPSRRALLLGLATAVTGAACGGSSSTAPSQNQTWVANVPFTITELTAGDGTEAVSGLRVSVDYYGWLYSTATSDNKGNLFDTSCRTVCSPYAVTLGANQVIRGFEQGILGMRVNGVRRVIIPPELGYGATGSGTAIPPNATLIFEIRLNGIITT